MQRITLRQTRNKTDGDGWVSLLLPVLRYRRYTYAIVGTAVLVALAYSLIAPSTFTSTATILPSGSSDQLGELGQLAAGTLSDVGLGSFVQAQENSSLLYPKILTSRLVSDNVLRRQYSFTHGDKKISETLQDYLRIENTDLAREQLTRLARVNLDHSTGFITLSVTTRYPELSAQVANAYLDELNNYNVNYRRSKARDNEKFVADRLTQVKSELQAAEDSLQSFQRRNLNYLSSADPTLQLELGRLEREVRIKEAVFLSLSEKYELAKLDAVKDVPVVQVLDRGETPLVRSAPHRRMIVTSAFLGSLFLSLILSLWLDLAARRRLRGTLEEAVSSSGLEPTALEAALMHRVSGLVQRARIRPAVSESVTDNKQ